MKIFKMSCIRIHLKALITLILMISSAICSGQIEDSGSILNVLKGDWQGEGYGIPGEGYISYRFSLSSDPAIFISISKSDYSPAGDFKRRTIRDETLKIYSDEKGVPSSAIELNNEDQPTEYRIIIDKRSLVLTGRKSNSGKLFRKSFFLIDQNSLKIRFEIAVNGKDYIVFTEETLKKK